MDYAIVLEDTLKKVGLEDQYKKFIDSDFDPQHRIGDCLKRHYGINGISDFTFAQIHYITFRIFLTWNSEKH